LPNHYYDTPYPNLRNTAVTVVDESALSRVKLEASWKQALADVLTSEKMKQLRQFLSGQKQSNSVVYPPNALIFNALDSTPLEAVKVVIIGQDPYHGANQANGLSFSVQRGIALPPSLRNIYQELFTDLGITPAKHGDLSSWAEQGVLMLNSVLTVSAGVPASHQNQGWEYFTDKVIDVINQASEHTVFILWGAYAQRKGQRIDSERHLVLKAAHPSPLAANRGGFFGCKVFSKTNQYLIEHGKSPIEWQLSL
jgi:uracil-DNA glycosylase